MAWLVCKFGGSSVATVERIRMIAQRMIGLVRAGHHVVMVLSAMQGETDKLLALAQQATLHPDPRELDAMLVTGEMVATSLMSMILKDLNQPAQSLQGFQARIQTAGLHGHAQWRSIDGDYLRDLCEQGIIPVLCGFQGVSEQGDWMTLGRGGSDTTAVAVAAALQADECRIYTDVEGVYTTDPRWVPEAKMFTGLSYEDMLHMAQVGAQVLHVDAARLAQDHQVALRVMSTFLDGEGTLITQRDTAMDAEHRSLVIHHHVTCFTLQASCDAISQAELQALCSMEDPPHWMALFEPITACYRPYATVKLACPEFRQSAVRVRLQEAIRERGWQSDLSMDMQHQLAALTVLGPVDQQSYWSQLAQRCDLAGLHRACTGSACLLMPASSLSQMVPAMYHCLLDSAIHSS